MFRWPSDWLGYSPQSEFFHKQSRRLWLHSEFCVFIVLFACRLLLCFQHSTTASYRCCKHSFGFFVTVHRCVVAWLTTVHSRSAFLYECTPKNALLSRLDYGSVTRNGNTNRLTDRLQSVLNAAARLVCNSRKHDRISPLLHDLHWLRVLERIKFRLAALVFRCRNQTAYEYPAMELRVHWAVVVESRRRLRSASSQGLVVRRTRLRTVGDRAFSSAAPSLWNNLPVSLVASQSLATFKGTFENILVRTVVWPLTPTVFVTPICPWSHLAYGRLNTVVSN